MQSRMTQTNGSPEFPGRFILMEEFGMANNQRLERHMKKISIA